MEQRLRLIQCGVAVERAGATTTFWLFFNGHYKIP
jgi:hypothetical protein